VRRASSGGDAGRLRELIIANKQRSWDRWRIDGEVGEFEEALKSGAAVVLDAYTIAAALRAARLDDRGFDRSEKRYMLDENDVLTESCC
jgi:hypothetical protein